MHLRASERVFKAGCADLDTDGGHDGLVVEIVSLDTNLLHGVWCEEGTNL